MDVRLLGEALALEDRIKFLVTKQQIEEYSKKVDECVKEAATSHKLPTAEIKKIMTEHSREMFFVLIPGDGDEVYDLIKSMGKIEGDDWYTVKKLFTTLNYRAVEPGFEISAAAYLKIFAQAQTILNSRGQNNDYRKILSEIWSGDADKILSKNGRLERDFYDILGAALLKEGRVDAARVFLTFSNHREPFSDLAKKFLRDVSSNQNDEVVLEAMIARNYDDEEIFIHLEGEEMRLAKHLGKFPQIYGLSLGPGELKELPADIGNLTGLKYLTFDGTGDTKIPPSFKNLTSLASLTVRDSLFSLPDVLFQATSLKQIEIDCENITAIPKTIGGLKKLEKLALRTEITEIPIEFGELSSLKYLQLEGPQLKKLPISIGKLTKLQVLSAKYDLIDLPKEIGDLTALRFLELSDNPHLTTIPDSITKLSNLETLKLDKTAISKLPAGLKKMKNLDMIDLVGTPIKTRPKNINEMTDVIFEHTRYNIRDLGHYLQGLYLQV